MKHSEKETEQKLKALGEQLRKGWKKQHPVTEEQLAKVREAVFAQWAEEQSGQENKTKSKDKDKGHGFDYHY